MELDALRDPQRLARPGPEDRAWCRRPARPSSGSPTARCSARPTPATAARRARGSTPLPDPQAELNLRADAPVVIEVDPSDAANAAGHGATTADDGAATRYQAGPRPHPQAGEPAYDHRQPPASGGHVRPHPQPTPARSAARARPRLSRCAGRSLVRLRIGFVLIAMVLSVFGARLVQLQGVDPQAYAAMAAAEGAVTVDAARRRAATILDRNGEPLAESVDGLMVVADPTLTDDERQRDRQDPRRRGSTSTTSTCSSSCASRTAGSQYIARRVPSTLATRASSTRSTRRRLQGPRHPPRPGARPTRPRRRRQPGRLHRHRRSRRRASS